MIPCTCSSTSRLGRGQFPSFPVGFFSQADVSDLDSVTEPEVLQDEVGSGLEAVVLGLLLKERVVLAPGRLREWCITCVSSS